MNKFEVGQRVVCINDRCLRCGEQPVKGLDYDEIYTVSRVGPDWIRVAESKHGCTDISNAWYSKRFRPLIIRKVKRRKKAEAPIPKEPVLIYNSDTRRLERIK